METTNSKLRTAIKLRHLIESINANWSQLGDIDKRVKNTLNNAKEFLNEQSSSEVKAHFNTEMIDLQKHIDGVGEMLRQASVKLKSNEHLDPEVNWKQLQEHLTAVQTTFGEMSDYAQKHIDQANAKDWKDIWKVIGSELKAVQGVSESAYMKAKMIAEMSKEEMADLTRTIAKHIPMGYSLTEADKYEKDYLEAMDQIKQEANSTNLWDKFLNVLAGMTPFEQSPAERVMMQRWLDGEKGEL